MSFNPPANPTEEEKVIYSLEVLKARMEGLLGSVYPMDVTAPMPSQRMGSSDDQHLFVDVDRQVNIPKGDIPLQVNPTERPEAACASCGYVGSNFQTIAYYEGDFDAECPKCGSTDVMEPYEALAKVVKERDELQIILKEIHEHLT